MATAFAAVINTGPGAATGCTIAPTTVIPTDFAFQSTDPATNATIGDPDAPVFIPEDGLATFVIALTPTAAFPPTDVAFNVDCENSAAAATTIGLNRSVA